jgi:rare lipoprotein A
MAKAKVVRQQELNDKGDSAVVYYGVASYYADKFEGRPTASGAPYNHKSFTAACNVLPLGTWIRVTNLKNDKKVIVQVNDRLHAKNNRVVDLSKVAASKIGYVKTGLARVKVEVLGKKKPKD